MLNGNVSYNHYSNPSLDIANRGWSGSAFMRISQKLPWKLSAQLMGSVWTGGINGLYSKSSPVGISVFDYGISLQRSFLKEDRLTVRLSTWDPIYPSRNRFKSESVNMAMRQTFYSTQYNTSRFQISLSYRFGSINAQVKKTAKTIENDDLTGRKIGNN